LRKWSGALALVKQNEKIGGLTRKAQAGIWRRERMNVNNEHESNQPNNKPMKKFDLEKISLDDLWVLHEQISRVLSLRIIAEKEQLEKRLVQLNQGKDIKRPALLGLKPAVSDRPRRKYPKVFPKYRNPAEPSETWSGRGKQPRWLVSALKSGESIKDFEISGSKKELIDA
jgi:DNA-binding protein H-NS